MTAFFSIIWAIIKSAPVWLPLTREILSVGTKFYASIRDIEDRRHREEVARERLKFVSIALDSKDQRDLERALGNPNPGQVINVPGSEIER